MAVSYVTLYPPGGNSTQVQVVEGSQLHLIYAAMGFSATPSAPGPPVRPDPFPQYVHDDEVGALLGAAQDSAVAALVDDGNSATSGALRAASVAAVQDAIEAGEIQAGLTADEIVADSTVRAGLAPRADLQAAQAPLDIIESMYAAAFPVRAGVAPTVTFHGPGGATPIASPILLPYDTSSVTRIGCKPELRNQFGTDYHTNGVNGTWTSPPWAVEFTTTAADFAMRLRPENAETSFFITVNGQPITRDPIMPGGLSGGSLYWMRLLFPTSVARTIRIYLRLADFGGLDMAAGSTTTATTVTAKKVAFLGDSWTEGTTQAPYPYTWANVCARIFDWRPFLLGQGGTGYTAAGTGGGREKYGGTNRLTDLYAVTPDYVIVSGSQNDDGATGIQAEAAALYSAIATNLSSAKIVVVGPQPGIDTAARRANRDAVMAAAVAATNVVGFIDPVAENWLTGTGKITARTGDGNRDLFMGADGAHPSLPGGHYFGRRTAERILVELLADGLAY